MSSRLSHRAAAGPGPGMTQQQKQYKRLMTVAPSSSGGAFKKSPLGTGVGLESNVSVPQFMDEQKIRTELLRLHTYKERLIREQEAILCKVFDSLVFLK